MTLQVPYDRLLEARAEHCADAPVYLASYQGWVLATCMQNGFLLASFARRSLGKVREDLDGKHVPWREGTWIADRPLQPPSESADCYVASVAFASKEGPGVRVDAYPHMPTQVQVLRSMYDELCESGELEGTSFEDFTRLAKPTVAIVSPREIEGYLERNLAREG